MQKRSNTAPIVLFVYNRPEHTQRTVEALAKNTLAKESTLYIFSDAAKNDVAKVQVREVREYIASLCDLDYFASVVIEEAQENRGLADSIISGVTKVMQTYGRAIILEDDLVTAPDFLNFMNQSLTFYKNDSTIGSITGYSPLSQFPEGYKEDIWVATRTSSHGWATWKDRWMQVDWDVRDFEAFRKDKKARKRFDECGSDRYDRLRRQVEHDAGSWSVRFGYWQFRAGLYTVFPTVSRLKNIGWDGSGVHIGNKNNFDNEISLHSVDFKLTHQKQDEMIISSLKSVYSGSISSRIGRYLRNNGFEKTESILRKFVGRGARK